MNLDEVVVTVFSSASCGPCRKFTPVVEKLKSEMNISKIMVNESDENMRKAQEAGVRAVPTIIIEKDGVKVYETTGFHTEEQMIKMIESL